MSSDSSGTNTLLAWYSTNVAKPYTADEAYGYWAFVVGSVVAVLGFVFFLVSTLTEANTSSFWLFRQLSFSLIAIALPVILYGFIIVLPLGERATRVAFVGLAISLLAVVAFLWAYPRNWNVGSAEITDYSSAIVTLYAIGLAVQTLSALLFPAATAGRLVERDSAIDRSGAGETRTGDDAESTADAESAESAATFELYADSQGAYRWRLRHQDGSVIADSAAGYADERAATTELERLRQEAPAAAVQSLESDHAENGSDEESTGVVLTHDEAALIDDSNSNALFEIYEDRAGESRWRLRHRNGQIIADGGQGFTTPEGARRSRDRVQQYAADADTLEYAPAGFEVYKDNAGKWRWRLRHKNGRILSDSGQGYASRSNARKGIESVRATIEDDPEIYEDKAGRWRWRLRHENGNIIATGSQGYASKRGVTVGFDNVRTYVPTADTLDYEPVAFEVYRDKASKYRWRLRHRNGQVVASSGQGYSSRQKAMQGVESVRSNAPDAPSRELSDEAEAES